MVDPGKVLYIYNYIDVHKFLAELFIHSISQILFSNQPKLYVARGMYEDTCSLLKYGSHFLVTYSFHSYHLYLILFLFA